MADIPVVMTAAGAQPTPPATLLADLIAAVAAINPGYTATLPGALIEDVSSTEVAGLAVCDSARIESINSLTPFGANDFLLAALGQIYVGPGTAPAPPTNTSVFVQFTVQNASGLTPAPGYVIPIGFTVGDGTYQYVVQDGGVADSDGQATLFCLASIPGTWSVPTNSVTQIVTSVPSQWVISCTNPQAGLSAAAAETSEQYRARVIQAGQAIATGTTQLLKTLLGQVPGVQQRLVSVRQSGAAWEVIVGGGDPYQVAGAIFASGLNVATLTGSVLAVTAVTQANPAKVTTALNHGYSNGQVAQINGMVGMDPLNGVNFTVTVVDEKNFTVGINTLGYPAYVSGGAVTPNFRNVSPSLNYPPDIYEIPFVDPPQQTVTMAVVWNTTAANFVSQAAVAQLAAPALADYVNSIPVGAPMNELVMREVFLTAIASVLDASQVSSLTFSVSINGVSTPAVGEIVAGDPESYFAATTGGIAVSQA